MDDFVMTRCARSKSNKQEDFVAVTYTARRKLAASKADSLNRNLPKKDDEATSFDPKRQQELEMKRLRWDVMKFGSSNLDGSMKHEAKISHAIQLGAKIPKTRKNENYKELKMKAKWEKIKMEKRKDQESGLLKSLKKPNRKTKGKRLRNDILDDYGKVKKRIIKK